MSETSNTPQVDLRNSQGAIIAPTGPITQIIGYTAEQVTALIAQIRRADQPATYSGRPPYVGLLPFQEADADLFFGREQLVGELLARVKQARFVCITGPSGSGKSSLARAGLIPALRQGRIDGSDKWLIETLTPRGNPVAQLANAVSAVALRLGLPPSTGDSICDKGPADPRALHDLAELIVRGPRDQRLVLVVDQFEETFTQTKGEDERLAFLNLLTTAALREDGRVSVVVAMRSDFISRCAAYPPLRHLINQQFQLIGAMEPQELARAIVLPALEVGVQVDPQLASQVITDMKGSPDALPLMQFALKDLFDAQPRAKGDVVELTLADYTKRGGLQQALERHAQEVFDKFDPAQRDLARGVFSHLVEPGRGSVDTRRTATLSELFVSGVDTKVIETVVQQLADARLVTTDAPPAPSSDGATVAAPASIVELPTTSTVTLAHEKLITAWPWLQKLVDENREIIAQQNQIGEDAREWDANGRDASYLYTGARLATAREQLAAKKLVLGQLAQQYVDAGLAAREAQLREQEAERQHDLEQARALAEEQRQRADERAKAARRRLGLLVALGVVLVATAIAGAFAFVQARIASARQIAARAVTVSGLEADTGLLLGAEAYQSQIGDAPEIRASLLTAVQCCSDQLIAFLRGHTGRVWSVAYNPDGKTLASASDDGTVVLWDVPTLRAIATLTGSQPNVGLYSVAFSPDGRQLAAGSGDGTVLLWDVASRKMVRVFTGHTASVLSVAFSSDGTRIASGSGDGDVMVWDIGSSGGQQTFKGHSNWVWSVAFSPDGQTLASGGRDGTLRLWNLDPATAAITPTLVLTDNRSIVVSVAFSPNKIKPILASGDAGGGMILWDMSAWQSDKSRPARSARLFPHSSIVWGLSFSPDGAMLVTSSDASRVRFWRVDTANGIAKGRLVPLSIYLAGPTRNMFRAAFSPDGESAAVAAADGTATLWSLGQGNGLVGHTAAVQGMALRDGRKALVSAAADGGIIEWDIAARQAITTHVIGQSKVSRSAFSPGGALLATDGPGNTVVLWDASTGAQTGITLTGLLSPVASLRFSPDGMRLASGSVNGQLTLWDVDSGNVVISATALVGQVRALAFSADGALLASGGCSNLITNSCERGEIRLWDTATGRPASEPLISTSGYVDSVAFSKDGKLLASGSDDGPLVIWDAITHKRQRIIYGHTQPVRALAFDPGGTLLASGSADNTVALWDAGSGQRFGRVFDEHDNDVTALLFSDDGTQLFSASADNALVVRDLRAPTWLARACRIANRNLTPAEWSLYIGNLAYHKTCEQLP
jgi:WD40 repeat protein